MERLIHTMKIRRTKGAGGPLTRWLGPGLALTLWAPVACEDDTVAFEPAGQAEDLRFGQVSVAELRTQFLTIESIGNAAYEVTQIRTDDPDNFLVQPLPPGGLQLGPSESATVAVSFRPCPAVVNDNGTRDQAAVEAGALANCPTGDVSATLTILDNTDEGGLDVQLFGTAVAPPNPEVRCSAVNGGEGGCGEPSENFRTCGLLNYGSIRFDQGACDMYVTIENSFENDTPVAPLEISGFDLRLLNGASPINPSEVRIDVLNPDGTPATFPVTVEASQAGPGETSFVFRLTPQVDGIISGNRNSATGLTFFSNDPEQPELQVGVSASLVAPQLSATFQGSQLACGANLPFRNINQGDTGSAMVSLFNNGTATLENMSVRLDPGDDEFSVARTDNNPLTGFDLEVGPGVDLEVSYSPTDAMPDQATLLITGDGVSDCAFNLAGGQTPQIAATPNNVQYSSAGGVEECRTIQVTNNGDAELVVSGLRLEGANPEEALGDDFFLPACAEGETQCDVDIRVAPGASEEVEVCYDNNDTSFTDTANLILVSNDPFRNEIRVSLTARDEPCLAPNLQFTLDPNENFRVQTPIVIDFSTSNPGGPGGAGAVLSQCDFSISVGDLTGTFTPNPVTSSDGSGLDTIFESGDLGGFTIIRAVCTNSCGASAQQDITLNISQ